MKGEERPSEHRIAELKQILYLNPWYRDSYSSYTFLWTNLELKNKINLGIPWLSSG